MCYRWDENIFLFLLPLCLCCYNIPFLSEECHTTEEHTGWSHIRCLSPGLLLAVFATLSRPANFCESVAGGAGGQLESRREHHWQHWVHVALLPVWGWCFIPVLLTVLVDASGKTLSTSYPLCLEAVSDQRQAQGWKAETLNHPSPTLCHSWT